MGQGDTYELEELGYSEGEDVPYESSVEREAPAVAWMKRNKKILLIAAAVTFCFIVALVIVFGFILLSGGGDSAHPESSGGDNSSDDNNTPPPLQLTDEERGIRDFWVASVVPPFLGSLNRTADPCDNFYEFACGGWIDKTVIPADKTGVYKSFTSIDDANEVILKEILEAGWPLLGPMYDQCMDVDSIESKGAQPLWDFGLSLISVNSCLPTNNASSTFLAAIGNLHRYGLSALFDIQVSPDPADPSMNLFSIDQGGLGLPTRDYYFRNDSRTLAIQQAYKQHITNSFRLGSPQLTEQAAQSRAQQVYDFELQLAKASMSPAQHRDPLATYHKYTMAQLNQLTPGIQWQQYFDTIRLPRDVTELNVAVPEFFSSLADQLYEAKSEDLCAYLEWRLLEQTSSLLSSAFLDETHFYSNQLTGRSQNPPRWKMCMSITESILGELLGRYYVQQTFSGDSKVRAQELIDRIKEAFAEHLPEVDWMDKQTERAAQQKLDAVADKIGYPDKWDDLTGLNVAPDNFYMNVLNGWKYEFDAIIPQAGKPVDKSIWYMNPQDVNAYYDPLMNEMVFPAAILQPPFYHPRYPDALNFGGIGSVMGHELTHGFDDEGRNFDANGELHQWWTDESIMAFEERTECPIAVYSEFPLDYPGNIDGEQTLGENLADMGGVKDAYRAFMKHMQETRPYTSLYTVAEELFGLTNEQLFFAAYGQVWCSVMKEEIAVMRLSTDVHSPGKARVDVPLAQTEEFGKAFNCPINSAMNPQEKCTVW